VRSDHPCPLAHANRSRGVATQNRKTGARRIRKMQKAAAGAKKSARGGFDYRPESGDPEPAPDLIEDLGPLSSQTKCNTMVRCCNGPTIRPPHARGTVCDCPSS